MSIGLKSLCKTWKVKKLESKKINKQIKVVYSTVHSAFMKRYLEHVYFSSIYDKGDYNCVTASMLYAIIFDKIGIPYKVMISENHVYLVANPGSKSVVIETTNPGIEKQIFTGEFKQQYVSQLRQSKLISEQEYRNKSTEEIFEAHFRQVRDAEFMNLPGTLYYNLAVLEIQDNDFDDAYHLCQKAYYFFPDPQVKMLLKTSLAFHIDNCRFSKLEDIDYLSQFARHDNIEPELIVGLFNNVLMNQLQYTDKNAYCDSLFRRLYNNLSDEYTKRELAFSYNLQMAYHNQDNPNALRYAAAAISIKNNHREANRFFEYQINRKMENIGLPQNMLDTIQVLETRYETEKVQETIHAYKLVAYLKLARENFKKNRLRTGEQYLTQFESECQVPVRNEYLQRQIEATYRTAAAYLFNNNYKTKSRAVLQRGKHFVPNSQMLNSINL